MRTDSISHQRRVQGSFAGALKGRQPPQSHGRAQRFGVERPLLHIRNGAQWASMALLLGAVVTPATGASGAGAAARPRPAWLPGAAATGPQGYAAVALSEPITHAANAAAAGCLARPHSCPTLLAGAMLTGIGGAVAGAWLGWHAAERHLGCSAPNSGLDPLPASALTATDPVAATTSPSVGRLPPEPRVASLRFQPSDLDAAQDPCQSLYAHVNARWANATSAPDALGRWHVTGALAQLSLQQQRQLAEKFAVQASLTPAQRVVADLWSSGMDAVHINGDGLRPLRAELDAIEALNSTQAIAAHLRDLTVAGRNPVFGFAVEPDLDNRTHLMAYAHQGQLVLPDPSDYLDARRDGIRQTYWLHIVRLLQLAGVPADVAHTEATSVYSLEQRLAAASLNPAALRSDMRLFYNPVSVAQADALTPNFSWTALFAALGVAPPARFSLAMPGYHREVDAALADTHPSVWRAYLRFQCLDMASPYLGDDYAAAAHTFQQALVNLNQPMPPRWKRVMAAIDAFAGDAMSEVYADAYFPTDTRLRIQQMAEQIRTVLKQRLGKLPWMDPATRKNALIKADQLAPRIGHPEHWPDWSALRTARCGYLDNLQRLRAHQHRARVALIGQPSVARLPTLRAHEVDAHFDVMNNDMAFSAALLQPPYFDPDGDDGLNYGAAGATIGHEMAHAFTGETSQFGPDGRLGSWWSEQDHDRYARISRQLAAQFDLQQVDGLPINGTLTANENMADLGGLTLALDALREQTRSQRDPMIDGLTREQRFFISWALINRRLQGRQRLQLELQADPHALAAPRADVAPSNMPAFAAAFQCAPGTPMRRNATDRVAYL